jgi:hypothetical protein
VENPAQTVSSLPKDLLMMHGNKAAAPGPMTSFSPVTMRFALSGSCSVAGLVLGLQVPLVAREIGPVPTGPSLVAIQSDLHESAGSTQPDGLPPSGTGANSSEPLLWEQVQPQSPDERPKARSTTDEDILKAGETNLQSPPAWEAMTPGQDNDSTAVSQTAEPAAVSKTAEPTEDGPKRDQESNKPVPVAEDVNEGERSTWIVGIGGGANIGFGEPTYGTVYGRLGYQFNKDLALSIRPAYIFGNSDQSGKSNNEGAFQMPLTLDLVPDFWISPFGGVGIATNTDSNGKVEAMLSGGVDFRLAKNVVLTVGLNYVFQSDDNDNRDLSAVSVLYFRF